MLLFLRGRFLLSHHDGLPGQRRRHLQKSGRRPTRPQDRQVRLQVAPRWVTVFLTAASQTRSQHETIPKSFDHTLEPPRADGVAPLGRKYGILGQKL